MAHGKPLFNKFTSMVKQQLMNIIYGCFTMLVTYTVVFHVLPMCRSSSLPWSILGHGKKSHCSVSCQCNIRCLVCVRNCKLNYWNFLQTSVLLVHIPALLHGAGFDSCYDCTNIYLSIGAKHGRIWAVRCAAKIIQFWCLNTHRRVGGLKWTHSHHQQLAMHVYTILVSHLLKSCKRQCIHLKIKCKQ